METALSHQRTTTGPTELLLALHVVTDLVDRVGSEKVAGCVAHAGSIRIQPSDLRDGEEIAARRGLQSALDQHTSTPETTDAYGQVRGVEVHVRGALRRTTA